MRKRPEEIKHEKGSIKKRENQNTQDFHIELDSSYDAYDKDSYSDGYGHMPYDDGVYDDDGSYGGYDNGDYDGIDYDNGGYDNGGCDDDSYDNGGYDNDSYDNGGYDDGSYEDDKSYNQKDVPVSDFDKKKTNRQIMKVMYSVVAVFVLMIGYIVYFDVYKGDEFINHPSNLRIAKLSDTVIRGKILASDGTVLAETLVDGEGNEKRNYPFKNIFAHVIGTNEINKSGLESSNDFNLLSSNINPLKKAYHELKGQKNMGDNIITTLDTGLQQTAYNALGNQNGVVVALEPSTGRVLAMVSKPDYDPNTLEVNYESIINDANSKVLLNQATNGQFAPGSIFKVVTALEYMREHPDYENYTFQCYGGIKLNAGAGEANLSCYANTYHGMEGFTSSFANSCNASFANMGLMLDKSKWTQLSENLLFNKSLPTDFPTGKSSFKLDSNATEWETGATAIGQGKTTVTPMHMAMITSAIANGGVLMEPYLVDEVENADGGAVSMHNPKSAGELMTTAEAAKLGELMQAVVAQGTASSLSGMGYSIAGKTGTAETASAGNNAWFIGYAPAEKPQIAVCVLIENSSESSSTVAVPIARQLFARYVK